MLLTLLSALLLSPASDTLATSCATAFKERVPLERLATPVSVLHPVSYNGESGYRRLSVIDGVRLRYKGDGFSLDGTGSVQILSDDMRMDQDYTPQPIFTLQQAQNSGTGTLEVIVRSEPGKWQRSTGAFAFCRHNRMHAPVTFGRTGIETLILDNANRNIPENIGYLSIPDEEILILSDILQNQTMTALMKDLGVYLDIPTVSVGAENTRYKPETAWNYETGFRFVMDNLRVEGSAYHMDVRNQQLTVFPPGKSTGRMMANAGVSRSLGAEAEAEWRPGDFEFRASYAWCDARFVHYNDGNNDYSGNRVPYVPAHTAFAGAGWRHPFKTATLRLNASVRAYGPISWEETGRLREPVHVRPDARIALSFPRWEIWLRGENLTGSIGKNFYFKSVGREFFSREHPCNIIIGISINH